MCVSDALKTSKGFEQESFGGRFLSDSGVFLALALSTTTRSVLTFACPLQQGEACTLDLVLGLYTTSNPTPIPPTGRQSPRRRNAGAFQPLKPIPRPRIIMPRLYPAVVVFVAVCCACLGSTSAFFSLPSLSCPATSAVASPRCRPLQAGPTVSLDDQAEYVFDMLCSLEERARRERKYPCLQCAYSRVLLIGFTILLVRFIIRKEKARVRARCV